MKTLIVVNDAPYGGEQVYNALRLAGSLAKRQDVANSSSSVTGKRR